MIREMIIRTTNNLLANNISQEEKRGICTLLEKVLLEHGSYRGFNNLHWINGGCEQWERDGKPGFPEKEKYISDNKKQEYSRKYYI